MTFDFSSKKKIILISLNKQLKSSEAENLGAEFFEFSKSFKIEVYDINTNTISINLKNFIGYFLHGFKLKSYSFKKYKSKKDKKNFFINVFGKNKISSKDQTKFKSIEEGTFYTRDLVSEPGNVLHPDEYAKRLKSLKKYGLKVNIYD